SALTLPPPEPVAQSNREKIIEASRATYGIKKEIVEERIINWLAPEQDQSSANGTVKPAGSLPPRSAAPRPPSSFAGAASQGGDGPTVLYDAICSICGKPTKVIFEPQEGRPIYCKSCLKKMKDKEKPQPTAQKAVAMPKPKLIEDAVIEEISFQRARKKPAGQSMRPAVPGATRGRKEINLSELRKALGATLQKKEEAVPPKNPGVPKEEARPEDGNKGIINPGQKINL
ncbi:MAG TPA: CxxC-x17-CxxC domain-containing protein, partial [Negativicutes bacterium]|nr:CxxC-x17-CxxC domain-containing protein [Negativicutes bacterium]